MATVEELIKQYDTDPELKKEVDGILADQKITMGEFLGFAKKHNVQVSLADFPKIIASWTPSPVMSVNLYQVLFTSFAIFLTSFL